MAQPLFPWRFQTRRLWAVLLLTVSCLAHAGFQEGVDAYHRGDFASALWEIRPLADQGVAPAQYNLGVMYANGQGVPTDEQQAVQWWRKAADRGHAQAQYNLGRMYRQGRGTPKDEQQAVRWHRKAAEQGYAAAQCELGVMYSRGEGVPKDEQQAVQWSRKAADQGNADAQYNLGLMYVKGQGVPKDEQQAYFWWLLASAQGDESAKKNRDILEPALSSSQRADAQFAARNWKAKTADDSKSAPLSGGVTEEPRPAIAGPRGPESTGSGWAISRTQLVSNAHVVAGCSRLVAVGRGVAQVQAVDARSDLALLTVANNSSVAAVRSTRLRQGDAVTVVGYPLSGMLASGANVTAGNVSAMAGMQNDTRFIQISAPVQPGNSGGPLLDASGNIVGVVVSKLNAVKAAQITGDIPQNVNFAVSLFTLQGFLEANGVDYATAPSNKKLSTADVAEIGKRFTVLLECYK